MSNQLESLCWWCENAVPKKNGKGEYICGCPWSMYKVPVEGWDAQLDWKTGVGGFSYLVIYCPKYKNDVAPTDPELQCGNMTSALFHLNYEKYGVDIFPGYDIYRKKDVKYQRIRKPWMTEAQYQAEAKRMYALRRKQWYQRNKEKVIKGKREKYKEKMQNPESYKPYSTQWGTYSGKNKEYKHFYYEKNKEKYREYCRQYRQRKKLKAMEEKKHGNEQTD